MKEELEKMVAAGKISRLHVAPLLQLIQCGFCSHRSWGFGRITTMDTVFGRFTIDFSSKPGHQMDLNFAAESLKPIPKDHIMARKAADLAGLREMAALNHLNLIQIVLSSYGGKATIEQIQQILVPDVITEDWRKWWEVAKRELKKDGHFIVPIKKTDPILYQPEEVSLQARLLKAFRSAKGLKARLVHAHELFKSRQDLDDASAAIQEMVETLNNDIASHQRTIPSLALEAVFLRDEIQSTLNLPVPADQVTALSIWQQAQNLNQVLEQIQSVRHKQALHSLKDCMPEKWVESLLEVINTVSPRLCAECVQLLVQEGHLEVLKETLGRLINHQQASSDLLYWLAKERSDTFADIIGPEVFRAILSAVERDQFNEKRSNRLRDLLLDDQELLLDLVESADIDLIRDLTRNLQLSPSFDDMDKRSLLARIIKHFPAIQSMVSGDHGTRQDAPLMVSWESLERRRNEYGELVHKKIPANSREIALARSYGDLRENHEYKAAKEMQKLLMRRKAELEAELARSRGTDFVNPRTDVVSIGTVVEATDLLHQHKEKFTVLGAWDFNSERGIISYLSPVGQALLGHAVGEEVDLEVDGVGKHYRIDSISAYQAPGMVPVETANPSPVAQGSAVV
ncbi:MAG TPA: GreA/GreB family elongation factor [Candidatus Paceibacterota bacterium]|nr:GreA/GreB family elongation factor [Verrucomicrobiota bacterium]HRY49799.1 GreA/GreB family elongation factor [Candidatus Paceibacterota bacterium]HSA02181.1 GreA/GreB family elongation factor [Candidatus Paceibacterota bacterium]